MWPGAVDAGVAATTPHPEPDDESLTGVTAHATFRRKVGK